ncbi:DUF3696 domain-containing protein [uncultured Chryseobacterium sp.]|uniref:AAA family ATPase n=1 Tax=uncultured Chryseobacterium sp. TaxID=259322 RepID=UPI0025CD05AA|nr:DUF3696 domain-containing protein [uncultured Chryseobacterium sp.]
MKIKSLKISNFKTLVNHKINLARITILAGANSVGKSSTVQSILFLRSLIEKITSKQLNDSAGEIEIALNGSFMLSLGSTKEVISWETGKHFALEIEGLESKLPFVFEAENLELTNYFINAQFPRLADCKLNLILGDFFYLNAERLGPRTSYGVNENRNTFHCGYQGEYTIELLARLGNEIGIVGDDKFLKNTKLPGAQTLLLYTRQWLTYIIPEANLANAEIFGEIRSTFVKFNTFFSAPNVGFGVSYSLPIIVSGLLAKPNSILIVENPEAHLHPKGQSRLGYFLGCMAAAGIQVIIETHSEHIINGVRIASMEKEFNNEDDLIINFYHQDINTNKEVNIKEIKVDTFGNLSDFPFDFFDQAQQDLLKIMKLSRK